MFHAFIIVCAGSLNLEIDFNRCIRLDDNWGPYRTEENCNIRSQQLVDNVLYGELNEPIFYMMGMPPTIHAKNYCEKIEGTEEL